MTEISANFETRRSVLHRHEEAPLTLGVPAESASGKFEFTSRFRSSPWRSAGPVGRGMTPGSRTDEVPRDVPANLLLIDGGFPSLAEPLRRLFPAPNHPIHTARTSEAGVEIIRAGVPQVVILACARLDAGELELTQQIRRITTGIPVILITDENRPDQVIEAM